MRINKFVAMATGMSRRAADTVIAAGRVLVNGQKAPFGYDAVEGDIITLDGSLLSADTPKLTVMLNKPKGYVCSRDGQGSKTIYELLPPEHQQLKSIGRLDKESSGLILLTNNGQLAQELTHPKYHKQKTYEVRLDKPLSSDHQKRIEAGLMLDDGLSKLQLEGKDQQWVVKMSEGRNRQIRRTFAKLGYGINSLHRTQFGSYSLEDLESGNSKELE